MNSLRDIYRILQKQAKQTFPITIYRFRYSRKRHCIEIYIGLSQKVSTKSNIHRFHDSLGTANTIVREIITSAKYQREILRTSHCNRGGQVFFLFLLSAIFLVITVPFRGGTNTCTRWLVNNTLKNTFGGNGRRIFNDVVLAQRSQGMSLFKLNDDARKKNSITLSFYDRSWNFISWWIRGAV